MYQQIGAPKSNMKKFVLMASACLNVVLVIALCMTAFSGNNLSSPAVSRRAAVTGVTGGILAATRMARAVDPTNIFETNCGACHQGGGNNIITGHTLSKTAMEQYLDGGWNKEAIEYQIRNGKGPMPAWEGVLSEEEIKAMTDWVYEQSTTAFKDIN
uniref:Cytochrome c-553 n=1 Tax=Gymnochlora stellata TaxID=67809 RepID=B5A4I0_GYMST|nr:cytochrome C6 precursor [Gymnochlora stellata]